jgi:hypothetical protein
MRSSRDVDEIQPLNFASCTFYICRGVPYHFPLNQIILVLEKNTDSALFDKINTLSESKTGGFITADSLFVRDVIILFICTSIVRRQKILH